MPVITVIGSLNTDMVTRTDRIPKGGETVQAKSFEVGWGGKGANQAVAAARLSRSKETLQGKDNITVRMIGAVGKDVFGPQMKKSMEEDGIDMERVKVLEGEETGTAVILVEESTGENRILVTPGANFALTIDDELVTNGDYGDVAIFQLESPMDVVNRVNFIPLLRISDIHQVLHHIKTARAAGAQVIFNPAPAAELPATTFVEITYLVVNESEAATLSKLPQSSITAASDLNPIAAAFISKGVTYVIITLGADGVFYQSASRIRKGLPGKLAPAKKTKVVDTTAAGDTFLGAFAVRIAPHVSDSSLDEDEILDAAVAFAIRASGKTVEKPGAQKSIPWLSELEEA
jgi:ribokinase